MKNSTVYRALLTTSAATASALMAPGAGAQVAPKSASPSASTTPADKTPTPPTRPIAPLKETLAPRWGNIRSFWGDNTPFWGNIRSFWGDTGPYADNLTPFWGNIRSFNDTAADPALTPSWGNIRSFAGDVGASWGNIRSFWGNIRSFSDAPQDYDQLAGMIQGMVSQSQATWGSAVQAQTGQPFDKAFADPLLSKYGIDLSNPASLQKLDPNAREHFFMDWWDGLMDYSGADHVDHWMKEANWSPSLTQQVGMSGRNSTVGILDFTITGEAANSVVKYGGVSTVANGHGAAVASLIVDPMDGKGVMGIAPAASVVQYNPFDATQTAGWADITTGVAMLTKNGATIINMSLGVPGWTLNTGWNTVFQDKAVKPAAAKQVFVIAAGNDGISQTQNIVWKADNPEFMVVGSVDPSGAISGFSNQPGTACLTSDAGKCGNDYLMNHYLVAPGELILVSNGQGGVTRYSGTSFAAPLVSGTVALIQDRWPWLTAYPKDVIGIVLNSATDLGAPGVDPVYGHGELNVQAALSPLDWDKLAIKQSVNGKIVNVALKDLMATTSATRSTWEANGVYFALFEATGGSFRDFEVPMSSKLANQTVSVNGSAEQFMSYLTSRFISWIGPARLTNGTSSSMSFTDPSGISRTLPPTAGFQATLTMRPRINQPGFRMRGSPFESVVQIASVRGGYAAEFGFGQSAAALGSQSDFAMVSDYDPVTGGANPFLGFASGGSYAKMTAAVTSGLTVTGGFTQRTLTRDFTGMPLQARGGRFGARPYRASAANLSASVQATPRLSANAGYTVLHEDTAVLGMGSNDPLDLQRGSTTDGLTLGANYALTPTLAFSGSATVGHTRAGDAAVQALAVGKGGITSTAFEVALSKDHLFGRDDRVRVTFAQPMHVEAGSIAVSMVRVIDRNTGELGVVTQHAGIAGPQRRYVAEFMYGRQVMAGTGELRLFGRANLNTTTADQLPGLMGGVSFRLRL